MWIVIDWIKGYLYLKKKKRMNELETTVIVNNSRAVNRGSQRDEI